LFLRIEQRLHVLTVGADHALSVLSKPLPFSEHRTAAFAFVCVRKARYTITPAYGDLLKAIRAADGANKRQQQFGHLLRTGDTLEYWMYIQ